MDKKYVYVGKKADGTLVCHTDLEAMKSLDGVSTVLKKIPIEEFEAAGGLVREIEGKIFLGKTEAEVLAEEKHANVEKIDRELAEINIKQARSSAEIADALANGREPDTESKSFHSQREERAATLRRQRAELMAS